MTTPVPIPIIDTEPIASVLRTLRLQETGTDSFEATSLPQVRRVYGGQVVAQALLAAAATVEDHSRLPHSLHAYFLRGGDPSTSFDVSVERHLDGRSFSNRHVSCRQAGKEILSFNASFQVNEPGFSYLEQMPEAPSPETLTSALEIFRAIDHPVAKFLGKTAAFDVRHVQGSLYTGADPERGDHQQLWMQPRHLLPQDMPQLLHRTLLAYVVDQVMLEPALRATGLSWLTPGMSLASLDHSMWFHQNVDINQWLLFSGKVAAVGGGRATCQVSIFMPDGTLVATACQEGMVRIPSGAEDSAAQQSSGRWGFEQ